MFTEHTKNFLRTGHDISTGILTHIMGHIYYYSKQTFSTPCF